MLYTQLEYYIHLFDTEEMKKVYKESTKGNILILQLSIIILLVMILIMFNYNNYMIIYLISDKRYNGAITYKEQYDALKFIADTYMKRNARKFVDLSKLFRFLDIKKRHH